MKIRLTCNRCEASFLVTDELLGQVVSCPKCGHSSRMPGTIDEVARRAKASSSSVGTLPPASDGPPPAVVDEVEGEEEAGAPPKRRGKKLAVFLIGALIGLAVAGLVLVPILRWPEPEGPDVVAPVDPAERTARQFLDALASGEPERASRVSTLADPPAISSYDDVQRDPSEDERIRGSFGPIADLHQRIASKYTFDPATGRFENANPLRIAADFMDEAERLREDPEMDDIYGRIAGGTADEQLDAAVSFAEQFAKLTQTALPRKELVPTYTQLVEDSDPPLPPEAEALALRYGEARETWDALLGRPFSTIRADGPFILDEAEVVATIRDRLASPGDPPRRLRIGLVRFRLDAIDTGWKVVSARREDPEPDEPFVSPGMEGGD